MRVFECKECHETWVEGSDSNVSTQQIFDQICWRCLKHKLKVIHREILEANKKRTDNARKDALEIISLILRDSFEELEIRQ